MNCGLSNLATLKAFVLPLSLREKASYDAPLAQIGLGVLGSLEAMCGRQFTWLADATITISADRSFFYLPRTPVAGAVVAELLYVGSTDFINQADRIAHVDNGSGLVQFLVMAGTSYERLRFTWTGGYWFDESEDASGTMPEGATLVPAALQSAFLLQCQEVFERHEHIVSAVLPGGGASQLKLVECDLLPVVKQMLQPYVRYQLL